jgi:hypothetical protein
VGDDLVGIAVVPPSTLSTSAHFTRMRNIDTGIECGVQLSGSAPSASAGDPSVSRLIHSSWTAGSTR